MAPGPAWRLDLAKTGWHPLNPSISIDKIEIIGIVTRRVKAAWPRARVFSDGSAVYFGSGPGELANTGGTGPSEIVAFAPTL